MVKLHEKTCMTPLAFEEQRSTRSARVAPTRVTRAAETLAPLAHTPLPPLSRHHPRTSPNAREGPMKVVARPFSPSVEALQWAPSGARWTAFGGGVAVQGTPPISGGPHGERSCLCGGVEVHVFAARCGFGRRRSCVEVDGGCELWATGGVGISSGCVGGLGGRRWCRRRSGSSGRRWAAVVGHGWPRLATAGCGGRWLPRSVFVAVGVALSWWRRQGAGWRVLVAPWWCFQLRRVSSG